MKSQQKGTLTNMARIARHSYQFSNMTYRDVSLMFEKQMASLLTIASHSTYRYKANSIVHLHMQKNHDYFRFDIYWGGITAAWNSAPSRVRDDMTKITRHTGFGVLFLEIKFFWHIYIFLPVFTGISKSSWFRYSTNTSASPNKKCCFFFSDMRSSQIHFCIWM